MVYLIYGTIEYLIDDYVNKLLVDNKLDDINVIKYNLENNLSTIIDDANTMPLFSNKKAIIVNACNLFSTKGLDTSLLEDYLNNYNPYTLLFLISKTSTIDSRRKIYKLIKQKGKIVEFNKNVNLFEFVKNHLKDYQITNETINFFLNRVGNDLVNIANEIDKLKIFKVDDKLITNNDIINLISEHIDTNIFKFIDYIISKNKNMAIKMYHEMLILNEEPIKIIVLLANQFRLMYQVKIFLKKGYTEENIANTLNMKRYPVYLAIQSSYKYEEDVLLNNLEALADLDIKIKSGEINKDIALELYLLSL